MKCEHCGAESTTRFCPYCGCEMPQNNNEKQNKDQQETYHKTIINNYYYTVSGNNQQAAYSNISDKSWAVSLILSVFFGIIGVHRFYVGKIGTGILYLLTGGLFGIGWIIDAILILTGNFTDRNGRKIKRQSNGRTKNESKLIIAMVVILVIIYILLKA